MVNVAQSVERRIVIPVVEGSIPFVHPIYCRPAWLDYRYRVTAT
jgi:hypothetical protein